MSDPNEKYGFCPHSSIAFLPWHRPYLALFEVNPPLQITSRYVECIAKGLQAELYKHVNIIAEQYTDEQGKSLYTKAAKNFRMPYWDWALPTLSIEGKIQSFPDLFLESTKPKVLVPGNGLEEELIDNPLASYKFSGKESEKKAINLVSLSIVDPGQLPAYISS